MSRYKTKKQNKTLMIVGIIAAVLLVLGIFGLIGKSNHVDENGKVEVDLSYSIGGLNQAGKYVDTDKSIYTEDLFECKGLETLVDFKASSTYQVFFYDENQNFVLCTSVLTETEKHDVPENAKYARIVITPVWAEDVKAEDQKITIFNKGKYIDDLVVKVLEKQEIEKEPTVNTEGSNTEIV